MARTATSVKSVPVIFADERAEALFEVKHLDAFLRDLSAVKSSKDALTKVSTFVWSDIEGEVRDEILVLRCVVRGGEKQALKFQRLASRTLAGFTHPGASAASSPGVSLEVVREEDDATSLSSQTTF